MFCAVFKSVELYLVCLCGRFDACIVASICYVPMACGSINFDAGQIVVLPPIQVGMTDDDSFPLLYSFISFLSFLTLLTTWMPFPLLNPVGLSIQIFWPTKWLIGIIRPLDLDVNRFTLVPPSPWALEIRSLQPESYPFFVMRTDIGSETTWSQSRIYFIRDSVEGS